MVRDSGILKAEISPRIEDGLLARSASSARSWEVRGGVADVEIPYCS